MITLGRLSILSGSLAAHIYACALLAWMLLSSQSWQAATAALTLAGAFYLGRRKFGDLEVLTFWYCILSILGLFAAISFSSFAALNPNVIGCALALGLAMALAYQHWWYIPVAFGGLAYSQSRGAFIAALVAGLIWLWRRDRWLTVGIIVIIMIALALTPWGNSASIYHRLGIWQDTINHFTPFGSGWGSFADAYRGFAFHTNATERLASHVYNDAFELIFELGVGAMFLWLLLIRAFEANHPQLKLVLWTFMALGLTYFPLYIPILGHTFAYGLGRLSAERAS